MHRRHTGSSGHIQLDAVLMAYSHAPLSKSVSEASEALLDLGDFDSRLRLIFEKVASRQALVCLLVAGGQGATARHSAIFVGGRRRIKTEAASTALQKVDADLPRAVFPAPSPTDRSRGAAVDLRTGRASW
jgi:hypothetical protein